MASGSQYLHHPYPSEAEYNTLKRTYLSLLPPASIIDICLIFEAYVPLQVRGTVWPYDFKASIATLITKKSSSLVSANEAAAASEVAQKNLQTTNNGSTNHEPPPMESLKDPAATVPTSSASTDSHNNTPAPEPALHLPTSTEQKNSTPAPSAVPTNPPYYSYNAQQPAYPHTPYYAPQSGATPYYPQPPPAYPTYNAHATPYNQPLHAQNGPNYTPPPYTRPPLARDGAEDLPSYEEMIVEALTEFTDSDGVAPKDLFAWMAARYPLQTNFRPSASQALQKAFKRGRLEKRTSGKYRLNMHWEGGTTTRRNTRRPQTQAVVLMNQAMAQPYAVSESSPPPQPYAYGYPGFPHQKPEPSVQEHQLQQQLHQEDVGEGSDAWEAAQNILKAINFGDLFKQAQQSAATPDVVPQVEAEPMAALREPEPGPEKGGGTDRAGLQAELALLAAQLAALGESDGADTSSTPAGIQQMPIDDERRFTAEKDETKRFRQQHNPEPEKPKSRPLDEAFERLKSVLEANKQDRIAEEARIEERERLSNSAERARANQERFDKLQQLLNRVNERDEERRRAEAERQVHEMQSQRLVDEELEQLHQDRIESRAVLQGYIKEREMESREIASVLQERSKQ